MAAENVRVLRLRCEYLTAPQGVDSLHPRLSWNLDSTLRGQRQSAYQILVASSEAKLRANQGDLWDSGKVASNQSIQVPYNGKPLASQQRCRWKVRVWDKDGRASDYSESSFWDMGLLNRSDWHGQWIGYTAPRAKDSLTLENANWIWYPEGDPLTNAPEATRYFLKRFTVPAGQTMSSAMLRVAADNKAIIYVNGKEVGRGTDSWKTRDVFDVKPLLTAGQNVLAIAVTNEGTAAGLAAELEVEFQNGQPLSLVTDQSWKAGQQAPDNWQSGAFDETVWASAKEVAKIGEGPWGKVANKSAATPAPHLRREFSIKGKVNRATVYVCGLGYYELHLNGRKVGDHVLDPGFTRYDKRDLYATYDVTSLLHEGQNALGAILGTGWYDEHVLAVWNFDTAPWRARPKLLLEMRVEYADGHTQTFSTDSNWKASSGPITFDSIYGGENYDARLEKTGWDTPGYNDATWDKVQIGEAPKGILVSQMEPPVKITQTLTPVKVTQPKPGVWLFDMGQDFAGVPELTVSGPAGTTVQMACAEKLHTDGTLDASNIDMHIKKRGADQPYQTDNYTLKGQGTEVWHPRFTYHGYQYVQVTGFPGTPTVANLRGLVMHSAFEPAGQFECSNDLLNHIQRNTVWSYISNFMSIPTDCPQREKNGWMGDAHLAAEQGLYNFDSTANYAKWLNDLYDEQQDSGALPGIVPSSGWGYSWGNGPAWDSAYPLIAWYLYEYSGDKRVLETHYERLRRYVDYATTKAKDGGIVAFGLGDWVAPKTKTPLEVTDTGYYFVDTKIVAQAAKILGKDDDAQKYGALADSIKTAFNAKFFNPQTNQYANGSLTALSCALYQGFVEPEHKQAVVDNLVAEVEKQGYHMDVGILGAKYLLNVLADNGRSDVAYKILMQRTQPSYGYWIDKGANTLWEDWPGRQSLNHIMFGDVSAWFYKNLAGITADSPGFQTINIHPHIVGDLTSAKAFHDCAYGRISSDWKLANGSLQLNVTIPANTTATIWVPTSDKSHLTEGGQPFAKAAGVKLLREENGCAILAVGAGQYHFASPYAQQ